MTLRPPANLLLLALADLTAWTANLFRDAFLDTTADS